jgi:predicted permease
MKNGVFWVVTPCVIFVTLMKEASGSSETSVLIQIV